MGFSVTIIGLGLMGGSLAKALRGWRNAEIVGVDNDMEVLKAAARDGTVDRYYYAPSMKPKPALSGDMVIVALHPRAAVQFITDCGKYAAAGSLWTDIVGVKKVIIDCASFVAPGADFCGGHPMAGRTMFGFFNSQAGLFRGCNYILVPREKTLVSSMDTLREMASHIGAGEVTVCDAIHHDRMIAYVSQMPHILAQAAISNPGYQDSARFEAGSFKDLTRVGKMDPSLWSELFLYNKDAISEALICLEKSCAHFRDIIMSEDEEGLKRAIERGNARKASRPTSSGI